MRVAFCNGEGSGFELGATKQATGSSPSARRLLVAHAILELPNRLPKSFAISAIRPAPKQHDDERDDEKLRYADRSMVFLFVLQRNRKECRCKRGASSSGRDRRRLS